MNFLLRFLGVSLLLIVVLLLATLYARNSLKREMQHVESEATASLQLRLNQMMALKGPLAAEPTPDELNRWGIVLGARLQRADTAAPTDSAGKIVAICEVPRARVQAGQSATLALKAVAPRPSLARLILAQEQIIGIFMALAIAMVVGMVFLGLVLFLRRDSLGTPVHTETMESRQWEMQSLVQLAKTSVDREKQLQTERSTRELAQKDLQFNQQLLERAMDEKIQLGRNLHDSIIQSLYSAGLTLEAARNQLPASPEEASKGIAQTISVLNQTIRDVRGYINGLSPEALRRSGFKQVLTALTDELRAGRDLAYDLRIDDQAAAALSVEQSREILQVARESISNSLRHGAASSIALLLGLEAGSIVLLLRDNGRGFDQNIRRPDGHGLRNMEARAARMGGSCEINSQPGKGTVLRLTLPILDSATKPQV